ncbi:hypothetical protein [Pseudomonas sp. REB1044]|uniref:hypothetical protein n=1 Tax=Pseudomonas sp. REB1044 TaxID=2675224 RepID=UPI00315D520D
MSETLSEQEMRLALFGSAGAASRQGVQPAASLSPLTKAAVSKPLSMRLRVKLRVAKVFEGPEEVFVHDANTLSTLIAEAEAKAAAKKKKFRYFEVASIEPVQL